MIARQINVSGSTKSGAYWSRVDTASVSFDHPFDMPLEYTLNLDFTNQAGGRVAVELDAESARKLVETSRRFSSRRNRVVFWNPFINLRFQRQNFSHLFLLMIPRYAG
jgi:hypothetical protein